jgi:hypothetical protein
MLNVLDDLFKTAIQCSVSDVGVDDGIDSVDVIVKHAGCDEQLGVV